MSRFEDAVNITLQHEGGYVADPADPGGETNFGISKREYPNEDIKNLTIDRAKELYREGYWKPWMNEIISQPVVNKVFDQGVLSGIGTAVRILQKVAGVVMDGVVGPGTLAAVNSASDALLTPYKQALVEHYESLVAQKPELGKFLRGWVARANS